MTLSSPSEITAALQRIAATPRLLLASDFDGTLSPQVDEPMTARMLPAAREAVTALAAAPHVTVAFVSGRSLHDLTIISEHTDDSSILLAGSHGAEFWFPGEGIVEPPESADELALRDRLREETTRLVADLPNVWIEPKTFGYGVHIRQATPADGAEAFRRADELVEREAPHWRRRTGHNIVEYAFRHEGKDSAVATLRERVDATSVLFAGDDTTDEDALRALGPDDLGVRVGDAETSASLSVADIPAFAALLSELAELRVAAFSDTPVTPGSGATSQE